jgi:hypothetical protein
MRTSSPLRSFFVGRHVLSLSFLFSYLWSTYRAKHEFLKHVHTPWRSSHAGHMKQTPVSLSQGPLSIQTNMASLCRCVWTCSLSLFQEMAKTTHFFFDFFSFSLPLNLITNSPPPHNETRKYHISYRLRCFYHRPNHHPLIASFDVKGPVGHGVLHYCARFLLHP